MLHATAECLSIVVDCGMSLLFKRIMCTMHGFRMLVVRCSSNTDRFCGWRCYLQPEGLHLVSMVAHNLHMCDKISSSSMLINA